MVPLTLLALLVAVSPAASAPPGSSSNQSETRLILEETTGNDTNRKWVSQIMAEELPKFIPSSKTNPECIRQTTLYRNHLKNLTLWAVKMYDASIFHEYGLLNGNEFSNGHFDQCVKLNVPEYQIQGQYCHAFMQISPTYYNIEEPQELLEYKNISQFGSVWAKIKKVKDQRIKHRDRFYWGLCIPSGCDRFDLENSLSDLLVPAFKKSGINARIIVDEKACTVEELGWNFSSGAYVFLILTLGLLGLVIVATTYHGLYYATIDEAKEGSSIIMFFSAISNTKRLFKSDTRPEYKIISGVKVLSMFLIIYGHRLLMSMYFPIFNVEDQEKLFDKFFEMINLNGPVIVNTFLFTTGFLVFNKIISDLKKGRTINVPLYILYRWARIVPVYLFIICIVIFIKPLATYEPLYKRDGLWRVEACTKNWWTHLLFINNYYDSLTECLLPAWYLAVDMQLYCVCVITGYIMSKSKTVGYIIIGFLVGISHVIPAIVTYLKGYQPILRLYINFLDNYIEEEDYAYSYIPTHMRAAPYFIGVLTSVILYKLQKKDHYFPKYQRLIGMFLSCLLTFGVLFYAWSFFDPYRTPSVLENSLYVAIHRLAWSAAMAWIVIAGTLHSRSKIIAVLRRNAFAPLNKLMLNALLIHTLVQAESIFNQRNPEYLNLFIVLWKSTGDISTTYVLSYILHLLVDGPFSRLQDFGLGKLMGKKT